MASQLENRLQAVTGELEKARQNQGLKDTITDLENKIKLAKKESFAAHEQKGEMSEQLSKMISEKRAI